MAQDVIITPADGEIEWLDNATGVAMIDIDANNNLSITNAGGDLSIGDTGSDVYIGDGTSNVDIVFEQDGEIRGTGSQTITLGQSGDTISVAASTFNPQCDIVFTTAATRGIYFNNTSGNQVYVRLLGSTELDLGSDNRIRFVETDGGLVRAVFDLNSGKAKVGAGATETPVATWQIEENNESTTQTDFTQAVTKAGLLMETQYTADAYTPGLFWITNNNNATKPKAGIYLQLAGSGSRMLFGTSNNYGTGLTNTAMLINESGNVGIGTTSPTAPLDVLGVRAGRGWHIANRAGIRLDANGTGYPSDVLFGHTAAANQTSWTGVYWSLSSRGTTSSVANSFYFYRGSGQPSPYNSEQIIMTFTPDLKVGINNTDPQAELHVTGKARISTIDTDASLTNFLVVDSNNEIHKRTGGSQGAQGRQGTTGGTGGTGAQGAQGTTGGTGGTGAQGAQGRQGTTGGTGGTGAQGAQGRQGTTGGTGGTGAQGAQGRQGVQGNRGALMWTPNFGGGVAYGSNSNTFIKSSGSNGSWNGQVYSTEGYGYGSSSGGVYCTAMATNTNQYVMFGLNTDPTADASYTSIDFAWYFTANSSSLNIYENGTSIGAFGTYTTSTVCSITYDGVQVKYWKDGVVQRTVTTSISSDFHFDSSFYYANSQGIKNVGFGPMGPRGAQGAQGTQGRQGRQGTTGGTGGTGAQGATGSTGGTGGTGAQGAQGRQGTTGGTGGTGAQGATGATGGTGGTGAQGAQGRQGTTGGTGGTGAQGATGATGGTGGTGAQGATGATGGTGGTGSQGTQGRQGRQGRQGYTGPQGASGGGSSSDYRMKEGVRIFDYGYEMVKEINSYSFRFKKDIDPKGEPVIPDYNHDVDDIGFLAHELQDAAQKIKGNYQFKPVEGIKDEINPAQGSPVYQKVHYEKITPVLWSALKETITKVEILEKRVKALENGTD